MALGKYGKRIMTDAEIYYLLKNTIDRGNDCSKDELKQLQNRKKLRIIGNRIFDLPNSIGLLTKLQTLDLSGSLITALPESLGQLVNLKTLNLASAAITALPKSFGQLSKLKELDLSNTKITALPDSFGQLSNLQTLNLRSAPITALPESFGRLSNLLFLDLSGTQITSLPESFGQLTNLRLLCINRIEEKRVTGSGCQMLRHHDIPITALPKTFGRLFSLESLDLSGTRISALPESFGQLASLQSLDLKYSQIASLPESFGQLTNLQTLDLKHSQIASLPESFSQLANLQTLSLSYTKISVLPTWIGKLPALRSLSLSGLTIPVIPKSLALRGLPFFEDDSHFFNRPGVYLHFVTLVEQDISIFLEHPELISALYKDQISLRECRVLFLGDGDSGKTYTIRRIQNNCMKEAGILTYSTKETPGVEIVDYHVEGEKESFKIHFWDFGGQEILHSMHRCFLTDSTCYVVTVKSRETKATQRADYWLRNVTAFAPNSPILLFINCWDNDDGNRAIDESKLMEKYPNIVGVAYVSAKEADDAVFHDRLLEPIVAMAASSEGCTKLINRNLVKVRQSIEEQSRVNHYMTKEQYHDLCAANQIENESAPALLSYFNSLGICFSYHRGEDKMELADYKLLNPVWLTNAVYAVIEEGMVYAQEGRIPTAAIEDLLGKPTQQSRRTVPRLRYTPDECRYVLDVATAYNLSYRVDADRVFFPALCKTDTPSEALGNQTDFPEHVQYRFVFDYLPDTLLHRLIIRCMKLGLAVRKTWLRGMILDKLDTHRAILRMDDDETLKLDIWHKSDHYAWEFFLLLRNEILSIGNVLGLPDPSEQIAKLIAEPDYKKATEKTDVFLLTQLLGAYQKGVESCWGSTTGGEYAVTELLSPLFDAWTLARLEITEGKLHIKEKYVFHNERKRDPCVRKAIWVVYNKKCVYCSDLLNPKQVEIDHILATKRKLTQDPETKQYLASLESRNFDLKKPDYIENYILSCQNCNKRKNSETWTVENLRYFHELALKRTPKILERIEAYRREMQEESFD